MNYFKVAGPSQLPFPANQYYYIVMALEDALIKNTVKETLIKLIKENKDFIQCLIYVVNALHPEHKDTIEKYSILT